MLTKKDPTSIESNLPPVLPPNIVLTDKQKMARHLVNQILAMTKSQWNVVMFRDDSYVWLQYFCGLTFKMPTIIVMLKNDHKWLPMLKKSSLVKAVFFTPSYTKGNEADMANKIASFIKKHPEK